MASQLPGPAITKLKGAQNWPTGWRAVKVTLLTYGLDGHVDGSKRPADDDDTAWKEADINARGIPLEANYQYEKREDEAPKELIKRCQKLAGELLYAAISTRADIRFAVCYLARYAYNPDDELWDRLGSSVFSGTSPKHQRWK